MGSHRRTLVLQTSEKQVGRSKRLWGQGNNKEALLLLRPEDAVVGRQVPGSKGFAEVLEGAHHQTEELGSPRRVDFLHK